MDKYEIERQENYKKNTLLCRRMEAIAIELGFIPSTHDGDYYGAYTKATNTEGMEIFLNADNYQNKGKVTIGGTFPKDSMGETPAIYENNQRVAIPSINISLEKTNEQIIKDIKRRFLEEYTRLWKLAQERVLISNNKRNAQKELIIKLGEILKEKPHTPERLCKYYGDGFALEKIDIESMYGGESATIEIRLKPEHALALVTLLKEWNTKEVKL